MKIGLKYTFKPNAKKLNNLANLLLGGFGAGGAFASTYSCPKIGSVLIAVGLIIKGIVTFTADED